MRGKSRVPLPCAVAALQRELFAVAAILRFMAMPPSVMRSTCIPSSLYLFVIESFFAETGTRFFASVLTDHVPDGVGDAEDLFEAADFAGDEGKVAVAGGGQMVAGLAHGLIVEIADD